jgi:hypothetical protein
MSAAIEDLIDPYFQTTMTFSQREELVAIAIFAWNITLLPKDKQANAVNALAEKMADTGDPQLSLDTRQIIVGLMQRKEQYFADVKRYILGYQLRQEQHGFHLAVVATIQQ